MIYLDPPYQSHVRHVPGWILGGWICPFICPVISWYFSYENQLPTAKFGDLLIRVSFFWAESGGQVAPPRDQNKRPKVLAARLRERCVLMSFRYYCWSLAKCIIGFLTLLSFLLTHTNGSPNRCAQLSESPFKPYRALKTPRSHL